MSLINNVKRWWPRFCLWRTLEPMKFHLDNRPPCVSIYDCSNNAGIIELNLPSKRSPTIFVLNNTTIYGESLLKINIYYVYTCSRINIFFHCLCERREASNNGTVGTKLMLLLQQVLQVLRPKGVWLRSRKYTLETWQQVI